MPLHFDHIPTRCQKCDSPLSHFKTEAEDREVWGKRLCESCDTLHYFHGTVDSAEVRLDPYE